MTLVKKIFLEGKKVRRLEIPLQDPCKIEERSIKKIKKEKPKFRNIKNGFTIPRVISMWKNPTSKLISLEDRAKHFGKKKSVEVNLKGFMNLSESLDRIEKMCKEKCLEEE
ncbi:hypothetical protein NBO_386g0027 [Nosema bombycis CQ1]|uniref:SKI-interacting protein SKIP SNW domain-containing protein n=1 Tax=Nosema bombycis (strain CQ1 / CVCC 102059) TaxID=578461 RepID=R0MEV8_NOSB1|nr:hypothetical protein NBO_386g0027 [Nosema bombycis CQ1]|eukprot:EOB12670.1 hypothetical protein NBO_386g0027 [Nosema bombycis CQ1]